MISVGHRSCPIKRNSNKGWLERVQLDDSELVNTERGVRRSLLELKRGIFSIREG